MRAASHIFVVSDVSLAGLRDADRIAKFCSAESAKGSVALILNRVGRDKAMTVGQFTKGAAHPIAAKIPEVPKVSEAAVVGKAMAQVARRSKFTTELDRLVDSLAPKRGTGKGGALDFLKGRRRVA